LKVLSESMCGDYMLEFKPVTTFIFIFARGIVTGGMIYLFVGIEGATTIKGVVLVRLQINIY
jgi:hypothetical protein